MSTLADMAGIAGLLVLVGIGWRHVWEAKRARDDRRSRAAAASPGVSAPPAAAAPRTGAPHRLALRLPLWHGALRVAQWATVVAAALLGIVNFNVRSESASLGWPVARGVVTASTVERGRRATFANVTYRYEVGGSSREGRTVTYRQDVRAAEIVARYPVGRAVEVRYDPSHPDIAVLEPGTTPSNFVARRWLLGLFAVLAALAAAGLVQDMRGLRAHRAR